VQWGPPAARTTTARAVGYRRMTGTRVIRVGQASRGSYGGG
jgi:hypothetical protein